MGIASQTRRKIYDRDGWRCHYCRHEVVVGVPHEHPQRATIDHMRPKSSGGTDNPENLLTCCHRCNYEKGNIPYEMYRWYRHMRQKGYCHSELIAAIAEVESELAA